MTGVFVRSNFLKKKKESVTSGNAFEEGSSPRNFAERLVGESDQVVGSASKDGADRWADNVNPQSLVNVHDDCRSDAPCWIHRCPRHWPALN